MADSKTRSRFKYPAGFYRVRVLGNTLVESKTSENLYLALKIEVLEKTDRGKKDGIEYGGHRYINLFFSPKTIERTKDFLQEAGFSGAPGSLHADDPDHHSLAGFEFSAKCKFEEYNGEERDSFELAFNWKLSNPSGWTESLPQPNRTQIANLNSSFGWATKPQSKSKPAVAGGSTQTAVLDEIPF